MKRFRNFECFPPCRTKQKHPRRTNSSDRTIDVHTLTYTREAVPLGTRPNLLCRNIKKLPAPLQGFSQPPFLYQFTDCRKLHEGKAAKYSSERKESACVGLCLFAQPLVRKRAITRGLPCASERKLAHPESRSAAQGYWCILSV